LATGGHEERSASKPDSGPGFAAHSCSHHAFAFKMMHESYRRLPKMADDGQKVRMVKCVKLGRELPGLDRPPWKGEIGKRIYESVSKDAWRMWVDHSKMLLNEFHLNPLDPKAQQIMEEQMEQFFFGEGSKLPEGYVAPKH
jgi:Fe-S cluster biosynthesis and repair protein YggX